MSNCDYRYQRSDYFGIDPESGLPGRQRLFVDHYITHLNAAKAYREAGYASSSYPDARSDALALLETPHIKSYVALRMADRGVRMGVSSDRVLQELVACAFARVSDYRINPATGQVEVVPGVPLEALGAVQSFWSSSKTVTVTEEARTTVTLTWTGEIRLCDKLRSLELLCKHLGLVSTDLPPLELLLNRLPPKVAAMLRAMLASPGGRPPRPVEHN